jgi:hypothetical protein
MYLIIFFCLLIIVYFSVGRDVLDPENSGKELEALSAQAGDLAQLMKTLISDIKSLEARVDVLMPPSNGE